MVLDLTVVVRSVPCISVPCGTQVARPASPTPLRRSDFNEMTPRKVQCHLIRERTSAGPAAARARGRHGGRPSVLTDHKLKVAQEMYSSGQYTVAAIAKTLGVSRASIYRHLTRAGG
jgi:DNA-binding CsgD family transcriptional regulator